MPAGGESLNLGRQIPAGAFCSFCLDCGGLSRLYQWWVGARSSLFSSLIGRRPMKTRTVDVGVGIAPLVAMPHRQVLCTCQADASTTGDNTRVFRAVVNLYQEGPAFCKSRSLPRFMLSYADLAREGFMVIRFSPPNPFASEHGQMVAAVKHPAVTMLTCSVFAFTPFAMCTCLTCCKTS